MRVKLQAMERKSRNHVCVQKVCVLKNHNVQCIKIRPDLSENGHAVLKKKHVWRHLEKRRKCVCNLDIPVRGLVSGQVFIGKISLFRENNFTSCNQIYFHKFWSARLHATEYPLQHNLRGYGVYDAIGLYSATKQTAKSAHIILFCMCSLIGLITPPACACVLVILLWAVPD